uniref:Uncharacterized protein n=1 Tax=uncultured marine group II/III euryarchaeote KM3_54_D07 TaxID=1456460 RepID=A0A075H7R0_9EURY|nr:hypothetical protein [uncultured marine group II/III euryarchaeote KM3_54_D07]
MWCLTGTRWGPEYSTDQLPGCYGERCIPIICERILGRYT